MRRSRKPLYGFGALFGAEVSGPQWESQKELITRANAASRDPTKPHLGASTNVSKRHVLQKYVPPTFPRAVPDSTLQMGARGVHSAHDCDVATPRSDKAVLQLVVVTSPTTTFRLTPRERVQLDRLANELVCSRTDVLRYGMAALRGDQPGLVSQIKADNVARAFLKGLITQYGENAVIEVEDGPEDPRWRLAGEPLDPEVLDVVVRRQGDRFVMDLVAKAVGVGIHNVQSWEDEGGYRHAVVPLRDLWVYSSTRVSGEPKTRQLYDGRTVVQFQEDDGSVRHVVIDNQGNSAPLDPKEVPAAAFRESRPSVGVGVRRESELGPHLGRGYGGRWELTGEIAEDRASVAAILRKLMEQVERGDLDDILSRVDRNDAV
jgi:hypothetical protein